MNFVEDQDLECVTGGIGGWIGVAIWIADNWSDIKKGFAEGVAGSNANFGV